MDWLNQWQEEKVAERMRQKAEERFAALGFPPDLQAENLTILFEFCKIAANLLKQEPNLELADGSKVPYTEKAARQHMILFTKCIVSAMNKCHQKNITGNMKMTMLQQLALDVFNQAKQVIVLMLTQQPSPQLEEHLQSEQKALQQYASHQLKLYYEELQQTAGS